MKNYIAIIRTSTERQEIESQRAELLEFMKRDGIDESQVHVIGEAGASAIKLDEEYRKNLEKAYTLINNGGIKCVYAWALDRIGRNEQVMFGFKQFLIDHKVNLKIVNPSLTLLNPDGTTNSGMEIAFSLYVTMSKQEMEQKQARFKRGKKRNVEQGRFNGGPRPLFGYIKNEHGFVVPDPVESEIVMTMFTLYSTGEYSGKNLSNEVFERYGKRIGQEVIAAYLKNPTYCGKTAEKYVSGRTYPAIISEELYLKCKEIAKANRIMYKSNKVNLCVGLIKCRKCGKRFYCNFSHYRCYGRTDRSCDNSVAIATEILENIVWNYARLLETDMLLNNSKEDIQRYEEEIELFETKISNLESDRSYESKAKNTKLLFARNMIDEAEFEKLMQEHYEVDKKRRDTINTYKEKIRVLRSNIKSLESGDEIVKLLDIRTELASLEDRVLMRDIIKRQIKLIYVDMDNIEGKCYNMEIQATNGGVLRELYYPNRTGRPKYYTMVRGEWVVDTLH